MSELEIRLRNGAKLRSALLETVSMTAFLLLAMRSAIAESDDRPTVWIELGGGFTQLENGQQAYLPPFLSHSPKLPLAATPPAIVEKNPPYSWDGDAKISFTPKGTDLILSASIRYGRNVANRTLTERTAEHYVGPYGYDGYYAYQNIAAKMVESHLILDFSAGKDIGLGMVGENGSSIIALGVRYAQFNSRNITDIQYQPTNATRTIYKFSGSIARTSRFTGIGPSVSWTASSELAGNQSQGGITADWGVSGALLFGRQSMSAQHQETETHKFYIGSLQYKVPTYQHSAIAERDRRVVVPNIGGFAGVSWRYTNAKVSFGYRADMFFGPVDGGVAAHKNYDRGFYGPFAAVSIGLGG